METLVRTNNEDKVVNEKLGQPFPFEYLGNDIDWLNMLLEREELSSGNALKVGEMMFGHRNYTGLRADKGVQITLHYGFGGGNVYIIVPNKEDQSEGKRMRVFSDHAQPYGAVSHACEYFIKLFEKTYPINK